MVDNDFERLRDIVRGDVDWEPEEEWARIDRMEAERDRLTAKCDALDAQVAERADERDRLQSRVNVLEASERSDVADLVADRDRLLSSERDRWFEEVNRLQAILKDRDLEIGDLVAEVTRLRKDRDEQHRIYVEAAMERDRLRDLLSERSSLAEALFEAQAERDEVVRRLGRMEGEYRAASKMITDRDDEIARLQAMVEHDERQINVVIDQRDRLRRFRDAVEDAHAEHLRTGDYIRLGIAAQHAILTLERDRRRDSDE